MKRQFAAQLIVSRNGWRQKENMRSKSWCVLSVVLLASGCGERFDVSPAQTYRPPGSQDNWQITGSLKMKQMASVEDFDKILTVSINGEQVIQGFVCSHCNDWPESKYIPLTGTYREHAVHTECYVEEGIVSSTTECTVFIDNERAAKLTF